MTNHFKATTLEFRPVGYKYFVFKDTNETISILRPDNSANNILVGTLYVDTHGELSLRNLNSNESAKINFHRMGWTKNNQYKFEGSIFNA